MSGPNLNLDYDPLEGPSSRIWKPKEDDRTLEHLRFFMNKFVDSMFTWKTKKESLIPETGSERSDDEVKDLPSMFTSMEMDREKFETFRNLARELGCRMGKEQQMAFGLLFKMAMKENIFTAGKPDEGQLNRLQNLVRELGAQMARPQRLTFEALCNMAMERFREQAPVEGEKFELDLD